MGNFERDPAGTYQRLTNRLSRLRRRSAVLPEGEAKLIAMGMQLFHAWQLEAIDPHTTYLALAALGNAYRIFGYDRPATALYNKALQYDTEGLDTRLNIANCFQRRGKHELAIQHYEQLLSKDSSYYNGHVNMSISLRTLGMKAQAREHLLEAIALQPDKDMAYRALVQQCRESAEFEAFVIAFAQFPRAHHFEEFVPIIFSLCCDCFGNPAHPLIYIKPTSSTATIANTALLARMVDSTLDFKASKITFESYCCALRSISQEAGGNSFGELQITCHLLLTCAYGAANPEEVVLEATSGYDLSEAFTVFFPSASGQGSTAACPDVLEPLTTAFNILWSTPALAQNLNPYVVANFMMGYLVHLNYYRENADHVAFYIEAARTLFSDRPRSSRLETIRDVSTLRSRLASREGILVIYIAEVAGDIIYMMLLSNTNAVLFRANPDYLTESALKPSNFINASKNGLEFVSADVEDSLYRHLISPFEELLSELDRISIVPYSYFRNIPLHLLGGRLSMQEHYRFSVEYLPSLASYDFHRKYRAKSCIFLGSGGGCDPDLDIAGELHAIQDYFIDGIKFFDDVTDATNSGLDLERFDYLHIAGHCGFDHETNGYYIALEGGKRFAEDLQPFLCRRGLHIFINSCRSGFERIENFNWDATVGLASSLLRNGCVELIATFWPVRDEAAKKMASAYYKYLFSGDLVPAAALQAAQEELIEVGYPRIDWGAYFLTSAR